MQMRGAKKLGKMQNEIPQAKKSEYVPMMMGQARMELNANPLMAALQRRNSSSSANAMYGARAGDRNSVLSTAAAVSGQQDQTALDFDTANLQFRQAKLQQLYNAMQFGMQDERNFRADQMENLQSKANFTSAKYNSLADAWNRIQKGVNDTAGMALQAAKAVI